MLNHLKSSFVITFSLAIVLVGKMALGEDITWSGTLIGENANICGFEENDFSALQTEDKLTITTRDLAKKRTFEGTIDNSGTFAIWGDQGSWRVVEDRMQNSFSRVTIKGQVALDTLSGRIEATSATGRRKCFAKFHATRTIPLQKRPQRVVADNSSNSESPKPSQQNNLASQTKSAEPVILASTTPKHLQSVRMDEIRLALVIGNSNYPFGPLPNPKNDAVLIAKTLRSIGFDVIEVTDATQKEMKRAIRSFGKVLRDKGNDAVGLFYYAGHGVQVKGRNYLIPVNAKIESQADVDIESVDADAILAQMEYSGARLSFIILDACRNNPFKMASRSGVRGLARMDAAKGALIAYATAPGNVASDGQGQNSPYTESLVKWITTPGIAVERMFREVRNDVDQKTNGNQTPWESSSLVGGDFYFTPYQMIGKDQ